VSDSMRVGVLKIDFIAIERDGADPHFLANLNKLGPVRVDHHMQAIRPVREHYYTASLGS
jgi:hypothetical protein